MSVSPFDILGIIGTTIIAAAYFMQQLGKLSGTSLPYLVVNLIGALLLMLSLYFNFNLASFIMEVFWIIASLIGLYKYYKNKRAAKVPEQCQQADVF